MNLKKTGFILLLAFALIIALTGCGDKKSGSSKKYQIGITQIAEHPSLDGAREGFIKALEDAGLDFEVDIQLAQGDNATNTTIAQKFNNDKKDLVLAIATPSATAAIEHIQNTPILFTAVTDPVDAGLVESMEKPGGNVTGTSDLHPETMQKLMDFIAQEFPDVKTVGIVANLGEANSVVQIQTAESMLAAHGISVEVASAANTGEVKQAAESLAGKVQAFFIPTDNTAVQALESIIQVAEDNKLPMFVGERDSVVRGGFAGYGFEYYDLGYTTGNMAVEILRDGKKPADIPAKYPEMLDLVINMSAAERMGVTVTDSMKSKVNDPEKNIIE